MTTIRIDSDSKFFIVVRDEKGKKRRIPVEGDGASFNADLYEGTWIESVKMPVLRFEIENDGEAIPLLSSPRMAEMEIR